MRRFQRAMSGMEVRPACVVAVWEKKHGMWAAERAGSAAAGPAFAWYMRSAASLRRGNVCAIGILAVGGRRGAPSRVTVVVIWRVKGFPCSHARYISSARAGPVPNRLCLPWLVAPSQDTSPYCTTPDASSSRHHPSLRSPFLKRDAPAAHSSPVTRPCRLLMVAA